MCCAAVTAKMKRLGGQRESKRLPRLGPCDHPSLGAHPTETDRKNMMAVTQKTFYQCREADGCTAKSEPTLFSILTFG